MDLGFIQKEKFITESYARQLELNKKEEMIVEVEEKMNSKKSMGNGGMINFYHNLLENKTADKDIRDEAKEKVQNQTNIDKILENNESIRQESMKHTSKVRFLTF